MRPQSGFTLIELLTVLAVLAIALSTATPSFREFGANQRVRTTSFDLTSDLILARSEALKRNGIVRIAPAEDGWGAGWSVSVAASGEVLRERNAAGGTVLVETAAATVAFAENGRVQNVLGVITFEVAVESATATSPRCIRLDPSGRPRTIKEACS
jgi:type IV fimbrial biogenesis protein FimT